MFEIGTATSHTDLLDRLHTFLTAKGSAFGLSFSGTGNGTFTAYSGGPASVPETFTITCIATAPNGGTFSVVGSVSGSLGNATVGAPFTSTKINFTINDGSTDFALNDVFSISTAPKWTAIRSVSGSEYIWKAPGNDGNAQIYVGALVHSDTGGDYYDWRLGGFTGYDNGQGFTTQPGAMNPSPHLALWNNSMPYWFVCNGRRVVVVAKVSTVYEAAYLGFIETYPSPGQWSYPLVVGGCLAFDSEPVAGSSSWRWSNNTHAHRAYPLAGTVSTFTDNQCQLRIRRPDGTWRGLAMWQGTSVNAGLTGSIWPYSNYMYNVRPNLDGTYPLFPIVLNESTPNVFGRLDGVFATTGVSIGSETDITVGRDAYVVFQNVFRTQPYDYYAVKLD